MPSKVEELLASKVNDISKDELEAKNNESQNIKSAINQDNLTDENNKKNSDNKSFSTEIKEMKESANNAMSSLPDTRGNSKGT